MKKITRGSKCIMLDLDICKIIPTHEQMKKYILKWGKYWKEDSVNEVFADSLAKFLRDNMEKNI